MGPNTIYTTHKDLCEHESIPDVCNYWVGKHAQQTTMFVFFLFFSRQNTLRGGSFRTS